MELERMDNVRIIGSNCGAAGNVTTMYPSLTKLFLWNMPKLEEWVEADTSSVQVFPKLEVLVIDSCSKLTRMPDSSFPSLKDLRIWGSEMIVEEMSRKVRYLHMSEGGEGSSSLDIDPISHSLTRLCLHKCPGLTRLTVGVALEDLTVSDCPDLTSINAVKEGGCLRELSIRRCPSLSVFDQSVISTIKTLYIDEIPGAFSSSVISFPNLTHLILYGDGSPVKSTLEFDDGHVSAFSALTHLDISNFKGLKALPDAIAKLPSLEELYIRNCKELESLPTFDQSHNVGRLRIGGCDILKERCKESGSERYKIQHIPIIDLD